VLVREEIAARERSNLARRLKAAGFPAKGARRLSSRHLATAGPTAASSRRGPTGPAGKGRMPAVKDVGEPGAREPHARFDEAAGGIQHQWPQRPNGARRLPPTHLDSIPMTGPPSCRLRRRARLGVRIAETPLILLTGAKHCAYGPDGHRQRRDR
jgi:hypothetical protein